MFVLRRTYCMLWIINTVIHRGHLTAGILWIIILIKHRMCMNIDTLRKVPRTTKKYVRHPPISLPNLPKLRPFTPRVSANGLQPFTPAASCTRQLVQHGLCQPSASHAKSRSCRRNFQRYSAFCRRGCLCKCFRLHLF